MRAVLVITRGTRSSPFSVEITIAAVANTKPITISGMVFRPNSAISSG